MINYTSGITFLYYKDFEQASMFFKDVLELEEVMDQGWAKVFRISNSSFIGCVKKQDGSIESVNKGGALISLTVEDAEQAYDKIKTHKLPQITELKVIESIPLKSFFFKDYEGYDFEIQEFIKLEDKELF